MFLNWINICKYTVSGKKRKLRNEVMTNIKRNRLCLVLGNSYLTCQFVIKKKIILMLPVKKKTSVKFSDEPCRSWNMWTAHKGYCSLHLAYFPLSDGKTCTNNFPPPPCQRKKKIMFPSCTLVSIKRQRTNMCIWYYLDWSFVPFKHKMVPECSIKFSSSAMIILL